jgi:hypothetical protein
MSLKEQIESDNKKISDAHEVFIRANRQFDSIRVPIESAHKIILNKFREIINKEIRAEHKCEHCSPETYDSAIFTKDGISMRKDADHPNDIIDRDWSWEEVEKILSENP